MTFALIAIAAGLGGVLLGAAHWCGWLMPKGPIEPRSFAGRFYVTWPISTALACFGLAMLSDTVLQVEVLAGIFLVAMALLFVIGAVVLVWQPEWFRPSWQRRHSRLFRQRQWLISEAAEHDHQLIVVLTVRDDEELVASFADVGTAEAAARTALSERADAEIATVLDLYHERIVRTIERETL